MFPHAYQLTWLVLITQNIIAQLITGPHSNCNETAFSIYYLLLFMLSAVIIHHFHHLKLCGYDSDRLSATAEHRPMNV